MARGRRAKKPRLPKEVVEQLAREAAQDAAAAECHASHTEEVDMLARSQTTLAPRNKVTDRLRNQEEAHESLPTPEWCEANVAFCCAVCKCTAEMKTDPNENDQAKQDNIDYPYIFSSHDAGYAHRLCCHGALLFCNQTDWATPFEVVTEGYGKTCERKLFRADPVPLEWVTIKEITRAYKTAKTQESLLYNADGEIHALDQLRTHEGYRDGIEKPFAKLCNKLKQPGAREKAVVLDAFAGVGTGIVALKRLGIAIKRIVSVEHDKVAMHVNRYNHDHQYNPNLDQSHGGIEHVYDYEKWEDLAKNDVSVQSFLDKHGPIDIIVGGPPCADYSLVNARREGAQGEQGRYMVQFGKVIRQIERLQQPHPVFFLAENVWLQGDNLKKIREAFGFEWDPILLDALYFSPTRRKRHFFTNIPLANFDYNGDISEIGPKACLEQGFCVPAHLVEPELTVKAQCLMASKTRIDERSTLRMYVFKDQPNRLTGNYHGRPAKACERESLMGYTNGYVEAPVRELFHSLVTDGLARLKLGSGDWRDTLNKKYHCFAGNYHNLNVPDAHRFELVEELNEKGEYEPRFPPELKMSPPVSRDASPVFFNAEDYTKHLIGNAYSVPVVEHLLSPLQHIFQKHKYAGYDYDFTWKLAVAETGPIEEPEGLLEDPSPPNDTFQESEPIKDPEEMLEDPRPLYDALNEPIKSDQELVVGESTNLESDTTEDLLSERTKSDQELSVDESAKQESEDLNERIESDEELSVDDEANQASDATDEFNERIKSDEELSVDESMNLESDITEELNERITANDTMEGCVPKEETGIEEPEELREDPKLPNNAFNERLESDQELAVDEPANLERDTKEEWVPREETNILKGEENTPDALVEESWDV